MPDFIPVVPSKYEPRAEWRLEADARASALAKRHSAIQESIATKSRNLPPLQCGDSVVIQNKTGNRKGRWDKTGTIIESRPYNAYIVRVDGSRSPTLRNRSHLRKIKPFTPTCLSQPTSPPKNSPTLQGQQRPGVRCHGRTSRQALPLPPQVTQIG